MNVAPHVFWAGQVTTRKFTGHSPFHNAHGTEPLLPFDITEAMFMLPPITAKLSMSDLLGLCAHQLAKREEDLIKVHENVVKAHFASTAEFVKQFEDTICDYDFQPVDLVLVLNKALTPESNNKCKLWYFGPMIVVHHAASGSYRLTEINGVISRLKFVAFCLVPYLARSKKNLLITKFIDQKDLAELKDDN